MSDGGRAASAKTRVIHRYDREISATRESWLLADRGLVWTACGALRERFTHEDAVVTCRLCRRRMEEKYAKERDGVDYRHLRYQEARDRAADRAAAAKVIVERHREEYEMELALLVLARFGREAAA